MKINETLFIITGTTQGLGKDLFLKLLKMTENIITINRSRFDYKKNLVVDLSDSHKVKNFLLLEMKQALQDFKNIVLVLNASMLDPIKEIGHYNPADILKIIDTNITSQILLTNCIVKQNKKGIAINITSGSAHLAFEGLGLYSLSKSAMYKFFEISDKEKTMMKFINFDPGNMNTQMQEKLRHDDSHFELTYKKHIQNQHDIGAIKTPEKSAQRLLDIIVDFMEET